VKQKLLFFVKVVYDITHFGILFFFDIFIIGCIGGIGGIEAKSVGANDGVLL
jgi:hypothetical protein